MAPQVSYAKTTLSYPIYAADFDPYGRGYLLTAGGGGESRSGIPNKLSLLDVRASGGAEVATVAELELSRDEDSPTCVAALATGPSSVVALVGVNEGAGEVKGGRNRHFRSFAVAYPERREGTTAAAGVVEKVAAGASAAVSTATEAVVDAAAAATPSGKKKKKKKKKGKGEGIGAAEIEQGAYGRRAVEESEEQKRQQQQQGSIIPISKTQLFEPEREGRQECYQRVIRLSPARRQQGGSRRLGAIATGAAQRSEVVLFDATTSTPGDRDVVLRVRPPRNDEAKDCDWAEREDGDFSFAYCTESDVYALKLRYDFAKRSMAAGPREPEKVYSIPPPIASEGPGKRKFRALRFLTPNYLLMLGNLPSFKGAEMLIVRLYDSGPGEVLLRKRLASHVRAATGLDVCPLDADPRTGARQIVVAVAGQDISVSIFTLDYSGTKSDTIGTFRNFSVTRDVHAFQITQIRLSSFHAPVAPSSLSAANGSADKSQKAVVQQRKPGAQRIYLATTSMGNTVVVDTIPLQPSAGRFVLTTASAARLQTGATVTVGGVVFLVILMLLQSFIAATYPDSAVARMRLDRYVSDEFRVAMARLAPPGSRMLDAMNEAKHVYHNLEDVVHTMEGIVTHPFDGSTRLADLLSRLTEQGHIAPRDSPSKGALIVRPLSPTAGDGGAGEKLDPGNPDTVALSTELHPEGEEGVLRRDASAKRWEELSEPEKAQWRRQLTRAGAWLEDEGETVLKGIFFSSWADVIGDVARQAMQ